jgi:hypothetical protein
MTSEMLRNKVIVKYFVVVNNSIMGGNNLTLDTMKLEYHIELNRKAKERTLLRLAKVHDILAMWQWSQNLHATMMEFHSQNGLMTAIAYCSNTE